jgi:hypothetical protein
MLIADIYVVPTALSLAVIVTVLAAATTASLLWPSALPHVETDETRTQNV